MAQGAAAQERERLAFGQAATLVRRSALAADAPQLAQLQHALHCTLYSSELLLTLYTTSSPPPVWAHSAAAAGSPAAPAAAARSSQGGSSASATARSAATLLGFMIGGARGRLGRPGGGWAKAPLVPAGLGALAVLCTAQSWCRNRNWALAEGRHRP